MIPIRPFIIFGCVCSDQRRQFNPNCISRNLIQMHIFLPNFAKKCNPSSLMGIPDGSVGSFFNMVIIIYNLICKRYIYWWRKHPIQIVTFFFLWVRERPLDSQGGAWVFFEKNILALVLAKKNILALTMCEKNILAPSIEKKMSALYPWKENVCPLSMKRKCLPSIYMKRKCWPSINDMIMDRGQV